MLAVVVVAVVVVVVVVVGAERGGVVIRDREGVGGWDYAGCDRGREGVLTLKHLRIQFLRIQTLISSIDGSALVWWQGIPPIPPKL